MTAADDILSALQASQYKAGDTAYGIGATGINAALPNLVDPYASIGQNAAYVGGASILSALLTGMAKNSADSDNAALLPLQREYLTAGTSDSRKRELEQLYPKQMTPLADVNLNQMVGSQNAATDEQRKLKNTVYAAAADTGLRNGTLSLQDALKIGTGDTTTLSADNSSAPLDRYKTAMGINDPDIRAALQTREDVNQYIDHVKASGDKKVSETLLSSAFPNLSSDQVKAANGSVTMAKDINSSILSGQKEVPTQFTAELQSLNNAKSRLNDVLPIVAKLQQQMKDDPTLTLGKLLASDALPESDAAALKSELPALLMDLQSVKPSGGGRLPLSEFEAIGKAINGTAPLSQGLSLDRLINAYNDRADSVKGTLKGLDFGTTSLHAQHLLNQNEDAFTPLNGDMFGQTTSATPTLKASDLIAQGYVKTPQGWVKQ